MEPSQVESQNNRGIVLATAGALEEAIASFSTAVKFAPWLPEPVYNRGIARIRLGLHAQAIADFTKAIALWPDFIMEYQLNRCPLYVEAYYQRAFCQYQQKRMDLAEWDYSIVIREKPDDVDVYLNRARARLAQQNFEGALLDAITVTEKSPQEARGFLLKAKILVNMGQVLEATQTIDACLEIEPSGVAYYYRAMLRFLLGYEKEAIQSDLGHSIVYYHHVGDYVYRNRVEQQLEEFSQTNKLSGLKGSFSGALVST